MPVHHLFMFARVTRHMTDVLIFRCMEEGAVELDSTACHYLGDGVGVNFDSLYVWKGIFAYVFVEKYFSSKDMSVIFF